MLAHVCLFLTAPLQFDIPELQPYHRKSLDGRWELSVDPSARDGGGPGRYRCTHDGKEAWKAEKPWTFWDALVTEDGFVAGYSYSERGLMMMAGGQFHVVILAPDGTVKLDEVHERELSRFMHAPSDPRGEGFVYQADMRRLVFRIADPDHPGFGPPALRQNGRRAQLPANCRWLRSNGQRDTARGQPSTTEIISPAP